MILSALFTRHQFVKFLFFSTAIVSQPKKNTPEYVIYDTQKSCSFPLIHWSYHVPPNSMIVVQGTSRDVLDQMAKSRGERDWMLSVISEDTVIIRDGNKTLTSLTPPNMGGNWIYVDLTWNQSV